VAKLIGGAAIGARSGCGLRGVGTAHERESVVGAKD
jgi:hypothetical protein